MNCRKIGRAFPARVWKISARFCACAKTASRIAMHSSETVELGMAEGEESRGEPSSCYLLMEEGAPLEGRCMTMPPQRYGSVAETAGNSPPTTRTATFSASSSSSSGSAGDTATDSTVSPLLPTRSQAAAAKSGILRQNRSLDTDCEPLQRRRTKKQVSITLPGSSCPLVSTRRRERQRELAEQPPTLLEAEETADGTEIVVEVEVNDSENTTTAAGK